jgi:hypothetical protein
MGEPIAAVAHLCGLDAHLGQPRVDDVYTLLLDGDLGLSD